MYEEPPVLIEELADPRPFVPLGAVHPKVDGLAGKSGHYLARSLSKNLLNY